MHLPIYQILNEVTALRGGVTRAVLRRARLLAARTSQPVHVLTVDFNPDYDLVRHEFVAMGLIDDGVIIHNLFEELAPSDERGSEVSAQGTMDGMVAVDQLDALGRLRRVDFRDPATGLTFESRILHTDGRPYVRIGYDPATGEQKAVSLLDPDDPDMVIRTCPDEAALRTEWLRSFAQRQDLSFFLSDYPSGDRLLIELDAARTVRVKTLHTNHLEEPYVYGAPLRPRARIELGKANSYDALVMLSRRQRDDVERQFGSRTTYHVVGNPAPARRETSDAPRDPYLAVGVGRYHERKRWDLAIEAFRAVVDACPQARLELWGFGPDQGPLQARIERLGLQDHVALRGTSRDVASVFASAALSVLSSPAEGFPLVSLESMAQGTPVVAFDANYGIADQIRDGVDGVLVRTGDTAALAAAMIGLFADPEKREAMGREALQITDRLSETGYVDAWMEVLESAAEQQAHRVDVEPPEASLQALRFTIDRLLIDGTVEFDDIPPDVGLALHMRDREPLSSDVYRAVDTEHVPGTATIRFTATVPLADLAIPGTTWDLSVSCSARNAHFFSRIGVPAGLRMPKSRSGMQVLEPYRTRNGNLSIRVGSEHSLLARGLRRLRRALGR